MLDKVFASRFIIVFCILATTGVAGFFDTDRIIFFGFPLNDYAILSCILYCLYTYNKRDYKSIFLRPIIIITVLTSVVILSMPFRGNETLIQAFQTGRRFYILLLAYVVIDNIRMEDGMKFVHNLIIYFGMYYSFLVLLNYFAPGTISMIWKGIGTLDDVKGTVVRHVLKANNGLLFVHLAFIYQCFNILLNKDLRTLSNFILCVFLFLAVFCMGFRAIMITTLLSILLVIALKYKTLRDLGTLNILKVLNLLSFLIIILGVVDLSLGNALTDTLIYAKGELSGENVGTLQGRLNRSLIYQIPMFLQNPLFGQGFVSVHSQMATDLGYFRLTDYTKSLYYFDFGYGTLLIMFGLIGSLMFMYTLFKCISNCLNEFDNIMSAHYLACAAFILTLLLCNYSFGALENELGLLPMSIIIGAVAGRDIYIFESEMDTISKSSL